MKVKRSLFLMLLVAMSFSSLVATEFRAPLITEKGPMRYVFEEWEDSDYKLKFWSSCYSREADRAYIKSSGCNGSSTQPLSALFFNKADFKLSEILPNNCNPPNILNYNPFLAVSTLSPRITYEEKGVAIGARFAYPIYEKKGRIGVRVHIPFRRIEIEREDTGDKDTNQLDDVMTGDIVTRSAPSSTDATNVFARAIRLDFLEALYYTSQKDSMIQYGGIGANNDVHVGGNAVDWLNNNVANKVGVIIYVPEGIVPTYPEYKLGIHEDLPYAGNVKALPYSGNVTDNSYYTFEPDAGDGIKYKPISLNEGECFSAQEAASKLWFTTVHKEGLNGPGYPSLTQKSQDLWKRIDDMLMKFNENTYEWLDNQGFEFATDRRCGVGDIDVDLFYEHQFTDEFIGEVSLGIRLPTGRGSNYCCNPYKVQLGNGEHFEVRPGILLAWQPINMMNVKVDALYSFVLKSKEKRMASFKCANIKNIGPCVDADVDWSYFLGHLDLNFFHPKTDAISSLIGYELYYKTKDSIDFGCKQIESWLGKKYDTTTGTFVENLQTIDKTVAQKNTQAIAHRIRVESSFRITQWFELFCGGAYTFEGKNIPRDYDCHGGCVVTF